MAWWLMKSEPDAFGIDDLKNEPGKTTIWDGVRNYQARNFMRDEMKKGDQVFIYHSSCKEVGIAGEATVVKECFPDPTQFDESSRYFDPKSTPDKPRWFTVSIKFKKKYKNVIPLADIKANPQLQEMALVKKGSRLSIMPVTDKEAEMIKTMI